MEKKHKVIVWFNEVDKDDLPLVGGKGANLSELTRLGILVPPGFIVTTRGYVRFLDESGLREQIGEILQTLNPNDSAQFNRIADKIKGMIIGARMPEHIAQGIREAYRKLGGLVAVRSSATAEDLPEASFAGQQRTFLNIQGGDEVVAAVQACRASLFEPRAIFYIDKFLDVGIDGISIGFNDLTQLILGIDRDSQKLAEEFDERDEAVLIALERVIRAATTRGVTSSICGQAPSVYPELTERLVEWRITSVSANPDAIEKTRDTIAAVEQRLSKTGGKQKLS